jgi:L-amino acid N-acyltransferase YncA
LASVALHEKLGFPNIGEFNEAEYKFGKHTDAGY